MTASRDAALGLVVASLVFAGLGSPLVGIAVAAQDEAAVYDSPGGNQISTATDGETVYINAAAGTLNGTTEQVTVTNDTASITITMYDTGDGPDPTGSDGEYWGSFNLSATTTDDATDTLLVEKGNSASATVDLDGDGNSASVSVMANYGPVPTGATTLDNTGNGTVDNVTVTFDDAVASASYTTADFTVGGGTVTDIAGNDGDKTLRLEVDSLSTNDTGLTPDVTVAQDAVQDTNGNAGPAGGDVTVTATDGAAPVALNATYRDVNADGTVDRIDVAYSEDVAASSYADADWTITDAGNVGVSKNGTGTVAGTEVRIDVDGSADYTGGSPAPTLDYAGTSVTDGQNAAPTQTLTVQDGAAPAFLSLTTQDRDENGFVEALLVVYTEPVAAGTVEASDFSIGSANGLSGTISGVRNDDGSNTLEIEISEGSTPDTGATPTLAYAASGGTDVQDGAGNLMPDTTSDPVADAASPQALSVTALDGSDGSPDGTVDQLRVRYSEDVSSSTPELGDYSLGGTDAGNVSLDSVGTNGEYVELGVTGPTNDTALDLTLSYDRKAGEYNSIVDDADRYADSFTGRTVADGAGPLMASVNTTDGDEDGTVEMLEVSFTESVDAGTVSTGDFSSTTGSVDTAGVTFSGQVALLTMTGFPTDTSVTPDLTLAGDSITDDDGAGNSNPPQTLTATDDAPPVVTAATTKDANGDGTVDRIDVTLSEPLDDGASTLDTSAFSLSAGSVDGVTTGAAADDEAVRLSVSGLSGSDATPDVTLESGALADAAGNALTASQTFTGTTSGAAPVVSAATTLDRDGDGNVDAVTLTFSGAVDDSTVSPDDWSIGGNATDAVDTLATPDDDRIQLRITADANEVNGTGAAEVTYTPGSTADPSGNPVAAVAAGDVDEADGATPVVTNVAATEGGDSGTVQVDVTASESLDAVTVDLNGPESATLSSYTVSGSGPYVHTLTDTVGVSGEYTATLRTAADAADNDGATDGRDSVQVTIPESGGGGGPSAPGSMSTRTASSSVAVFGATGTVSFDLGADSVGRVQVDSEATGTGFARATALSSPPNGVASPDPRTVGVVSIQMPEDWRTTPATLRITVDTSAASVPPERLRIARYDESAGEWQAFDTVVESRSGSAAVLAAETPGFSTFAVVESSASATDATTATPTPAQSGDGATTTPTDTPAPTAGPSESAPTTDATTATPTPATAGDGPGFGTLAALAAFAALATLVARRRN